MTTPVGVVESAVFRARHVFDGERLLTPGWVGVRAGRITGVGEGVPPGALGAVRHFGEVTLAPGFVDLHCHGGGGAAFTDGPDAARTAAHVHHRHGTTTLVASLVSDELEQIEAQVRQLVPLVQADEVAGIHLEGPWLSAAQCGAHRRQVLADPDPAAVGQLIDAGAGAIAMVTLAPERLGAIAAVRSLVAAGVIAAVGHTDATYDETVVAIEAGAGVATHLFNAQRGLHHREPGPIMALLQDERVVIELIADGVHLHPSVVAFAAGVAAGRFVLVTDAMAAAGAPDGNYRLGPLAVRVTDGVARVVDSGAIAGSTLTLDRALRYAVQVVGLPLEDVLRAVTTTPARVLGRSDIGRLAVGAQADLVVLTDALQVEAVLRRGRWVDPVAGCDPADGGHRHSY